MQRPTMTLADVETAMQKAGFRVSTRTISEGISSGRYPFGTIIGTGDTGRRRFEIMRVDFEKWLKEKTANG